MFGVERKPNRIVDKFKACVVAKGCNQRLELDYHETFSPVVQTETIRVVLSIAVVNSWELRQLDVNAFLHSPLSKTMYMVQHLGFKDPTKLNYVCRL